MEVDSNSENKVMFMTKLQSLKLDSSFIFQEIRK